MQSRDYRTFLIHALSPEADHDIVGKVNVTDVVRGRFESAAMGYDAYDPYAGRGLFAEGLRLVLNLVFTQETAPEGPLGSALGVGPCHALGALLEDSPVGGVVESWLRPGDVRFVVEGLQRCGLDPAAVPEVWCFSQEAAARPLGLGPTVALDTGQDVGRADVVRIPLQVLAGGLLPPSET